MSYKLEEIKLTKLKSLWTEINPKLPAEIAAKLKQQLQLILDNENGSKTKNLVDFVQLCCEYNPKNFEEYVAYVMIATSINFLSVSSPFFRVEKSRLMSHTFSTYVPFWSRDQNKVQIHLNLLRLVKKCHYHQFFLLFYILFFI